MVKAKLVRQLSYLWVLDTNDLKTSVANQPGYFKECVFTLSWLKNDAGIGSCEISGWC